MTESTESVEVARTQELVPAIVYDEEYNRVLAELQKLRQVEALTFVRFKHQVGMVILEYIEAHPTAVVTAVIQSFAVDLHRATSWTDFYNCYRFARLFPSAEQLDGFLRAVKEDGYEPSWWWIRQNYLPEKSEEEKRADKDADLRKEVAKYQRKAERLEEEGEELKQKLAGTDVEEELESVLFKVRETEEEAERMGRDDASGTDSVSFRMAAYRLWVRDHEGCAICGDTEIELAHFPRTEGAGGRGFDVIPLCRTHHQEQHDTGIRTFTAEHLEELYACLCSILPVRSRILKGS